MIRSILAISLGTMIVPFAQAESVTAQHAMQELRDRGASIRDSVLIFGEPMISAEHDDQGYRLVLSQCAKPDYACKVSVFSACQTAGQLSPEELISFANNLNKQPTSRGTVYADRDGGIGNVICIRQRRDLHQEDIFDMADVFTWHTILRDFTAEVEEAKRDKQVRDLLGIDDATGSGTPREAYAQSPLQ